MRQIPVLVEQIDLVSLLWKYFDWYRLKYVDSGKPQMIKITPREVY